MKFAGYIGTTISLGLAFIFQQYAVDEFVKFLTWTVPATISIISWGLQIFITSQRVRRRFIVGIMDEVKTELAHLEDRVAKKATEELWLRIPTIIRIQHHEQGLKNSEAEGAI